MKLKQIIELINSTYLLLNKKLVRNTIYQIIKK